MYTRNLGEDSAPMYVKKQMKMKNIIRLDNAESKKVNKEMYGGKNEFRTVGLLK